MTLFVQNRGMSFLILRPIGQILSKNEYIQQLGRIAEKLLYSRQIPVHWNIPPGILADPAVQETVNHELAFLLPAGISERPHILLSDQEILHDFDWKEEDISMPDQKFLKLYFPYYPDTGRRSAESLYPSGTTLFLLCREDKRKATHELRLKGKAGIPIDYYPSGSKEPDFGPPGPPGESS